MLEKGEELRHESQRSRENRIAGVVENALREAAELQRESETEDPKLANILVYSDSHGYLYRLTVTGVGWRRPENGEKEEEG